MAQNDSMFFLTPKSAIPTGTAFATKAVITDGSTVAGLIPVIAFPGVTPDSHAEWIIPVPSWYDGGGLDFEINFATDGTVSADVQFEVRVDKIVAGDNLSTHDLQGQTATDVTDTPSTTADVLDVAPVGAVSHANAGSPAVGDFLRIRISRDFDHASNTDAAQLVGAVVTES